MEASYPELNDTFHEVSESAYGEEDAFRRTLETGTTILDVAVNKAKSDSAEPVVAGEDAFKLHDTYGFPIELTLEMAAEQGVKVDEAKFRELMAEQSPAPAPTPQEASQRGSFRLRRLQEDARQPDRLPRLHRHVRPRQGDRHHAGRQGSVPAVTGPANVEVILDRTPFYAEAGGQLADQGEILSDDGAVLEVDDVQKPSRTSSSTSAV